MESKYLKAKRKIGFFSMLNESLLMDREPLNLGTFESSFSTWKKKMKTNEYSEAILFFKQVLNIK